MKSLEKAVSGDFDAMQEVIKLLKPYMKRGSMKNTGQRKNFCISGR